MGRIYTVSFKDVAISAAQDLISIVTPSTMAISLHSAIFGQRTLTAWEAKPVNLKRFSSTYTIGSAGTNPTPAKANFNDAASLLTGCRANDTTQAVVNTGALVQEYSDDWIFQNGFFYLPPPEDRLTLPPSQAFVFGLDVAPSG